MNKKDLELLDNIILSTKGQNVNVTPKVVDSFKCQDRDINKKATQFLFDLKNPDNSEEYGFRVTINRCTGQYYFKNWGDEGASYYTKVVVLYKRSNYYDEGWNGYSWESVDEFNFEEYPLDKQKELFNILMDKHREYNEKSDNEKYEKYLNAAKKLQSKDILSDEKLEKLEKLLNK